MQRRKFLIGMGSLAAGTAAATGTGAFSSVSANRDVAVSVAGDQSAYLALDATSAYAANITSTAEGDQGELALDFTGAYGDQNGSGLNTAAETGVEDVFTITNQGTNGVYVWIATNDYNAGGATSVETVAGDEGNVGTSQGDNSEVDISYPDGAGSSGAEISSNGPSRTPGGYVYLNAGESTSVDINFFVNDSDPETWYKEWQINADTSAPVAGDYSDSGLQGHSDDDLSTDDV
ncbi:hypothetical protein [Haloarcula litorea]|uniref:hypothetical protein n=1 Tax=Haloarcula litorea TaxID=3032579 RepID=UPI0023E85DC1|nr:hypothetical protein [Halomicroarcula sp. GDY20]